MKKNSKYTYVEGKQLTDHGSGTRVYEIEGARLPSVTTILGATKDQQFLRDWKAKVGEAEAERIKNVSSSRGTLVHKFMEHHILGTGYDDLTQLGQQAKAMAAKIIDVGLTPVEEYFGSEVMLKYSGLFAGSCDLVCKHDGIETVVDFKQSNRPKRDEWVTDYKLQCAMYALAHDDQHKSNIEQCVIMMVTPDLYYQEWKLKGDELRHCKHEALKRIDRFYEMKRDEKENAKVEIKEQDFLERAEQEKKELAESYKESLRQANERKFNEQ